MGSANTGKGKKAVHQRVNNRLPLNFFRRDVLTVAPELLGKVIVRKFDNESTAKHIITEVEAYRGTEDLACHASKGRTPRTDIMFGPGGTIYVYLIYGIHWMLNIVTGNENDASAVLIRGVKDVSGPGRVGKILRLDKSFYGESLSRSNRLWIEHAPPVKTYSVSKRVGVEYAGKHWAEKPWRFILK